MAATTSQITTPLIGPSLTQVWKPPTGVTPGAAGDKYAPFALNTRVVTNDLTLDLARFARAGGTIAADATVGITTGGVTTTAAANNTYTNKTGVELVAGDYAFLMAQTQILPLS